MPQADSDSALKHEPTIQELFDLSGKVVLLTGGTGHLGSAMARALAEAGASGLGPGRAPARAESAPAALPSPTSARPRGLALDHMRPDELDRAFQRAVDNVGH